MERALALLWKREEGRKQFIEGARQGFKGEEEHCRATS
jgi:hypothetical protein